MNITRFLRDNFLLLFYVTRPSKALVAVSDQTVSCRPVWNDTFVYTVVYLCMNGILKQFILD